MIDIKIANWLDGSETISSKGLSNLKITKTETTKIPQRDLHLNGWTHEDTDDQEGTAEVHNRQGQRRRHVWHCWLHDGCADTDIPNSVGCTSWVCIVTAIEVICANAGDYRTVHKKNMFHIKLSIITTMIVE